MPSRISFGVRLFPLWGVTAWVMTSCGYDYKRWYPTPEFSDRQVLAEILGKPAANAWLEAVASRSTDDAEEDPQTVGTRPPQTGLKELYRRLRIEAATELESDVRALAIRNDCRLRLMYGHEFDELAGFRGEQAHQIGLCLSGGGIRSAAFSLGVLRGLDSIGALDDVGYLSTVSGGGFAGAWYVTHRDDGLLRPGSPYVERFLKTGHYLWSGNFSQSRWRALSVFVHHTLRLHEVWAWNFLIDTQTNVTSFVRTAYRGAIAEAFLYDDVWLPRAGNAESAAWSLTIPLAIAHFLLWTPFEGERQGARLFGVELLALLPMLFRDASRYPHIAKLPVSDLEAPSKRPFWIANAHVSLVDSDDPAVVSRSGDAFEFTRHRCGCDALGFVASNGRGWQKLDTICAVSAAAVDSESLRQGELTSAALKALGLDLGYWVDSWGDGWVKGDRGTGGKFLKYAFEAIAPIRWVTQFFWNTHGLREDAGSYLLTDGGHFDNLGLYALVRRGCRTIIVCDATGEPEMSGWESKTPSQRASLFRDFHDTAQKIRADFGATVSLRWNDFDPRVRTRSFGDDTSGPAIVMRGTIHDLPVLAEPGNLESEVLRSVELIYIRAAYDFDDAVPRRNSFVAAEKARTPEFPNVPTSDQDYTEAHMTALMQLAYDAVLRDRVRIQEVMEVGKR